MRKYAVLTGVLLTAGMLFADEVTKRTELTLNQPVIVAGVPTVTLEPGKYAIRILNMSHTKNIVQIFNEDQTKLFTTVMAINNYRLNTTDKTELKYWETPTGNPVALKAWFFPFDNWGQEFVYPKGLAAKIAKETGQPVPAATAETPAEMAAAPVVEITKEGKEEPLPEVAAAPAPEPAPAPVEVAAAPEPPPAEPLPKTASPFFLIGLAGALAGTAGAALRKFAK